MTEYYPPNGGSAHGFNSVDFRTPNDNILTILEGDEKYEKKGATSASNWSGNKFADPISIGTDSGQDQKAKCIAIGYKSAEGPQGGDLSQQLGSIAIGKYSGQTGMKFDSCAIGAYSGRDNMGVYDENRNVSNEGNCVGLGFKSAMTDCGVGATCLGAYSGSEECGAYATCCGYAAGRYGCGEYSVCLGVKSGYGRYTSGGTVYETPFTEKCIGISATGDIENFGWTNQFYIGGPNRFYMKPIRGISNLASDPQMWYNPTTGEIVYQT